MNSHYDNVLTLTNTSIQNNLFFCVYKIILIYTQRYLRNKILNHVNILAQNPRRKQL